MKEFVDLPVIHRQAPPSGTVRAVRQEEPRLTIVALHGLATEASQIDKAFAYVTRHISSPAIRWVFPRALRRDVSLLGGARAFAWYDVRTHDRTELDIAGIREAVAHVHDVLDGERSRLDAGQRLALVGFSQGGALALQAGLSAPAGVDGIVALSTAIPLPEEVRPVLGHGPRIFLAHGTRDPEVSLSLGLDTCRLLRSRGYEVEWHEYWTGHTVEGRELRHIARWLDRCFLRNPVPVGHSSTPAQKSAGSVVPFENLPSIQL